MTQETHTYEAPEKYGLEQSQVGEGGTLKRHKYMTKKARRNKMAE